jgi:hypothetical protein
VELARWEEVGVVAGLSGRNLREHAEALFAKPENKPFVAGYAEALRVNLRDLAASYQRTLLLGVVLMASFELLVRAAISKASIGPFEVSDLSLIRVALPALVAFVYFQLLAIESARVLLEDVHAAVLRAVYPEVAGSYLVGLTTPPAPAAQGALVFPLAGIGALARRRLVRAFDSASTIAVFVLFVAFEIYAHALQVARFGLSVLLVVAFLTSAWFMHTGLHTFFSLLGLTEERNP